MQSVFTQRVGNMTQIKKRGDKHKYDVRSRECIGLSCLNIHPRQVRGATGSGSRNTGRWVHACTHRDYYGCPRPLPVFDKNLARDRRAEGMKIV